MRTKTILILLAVLGIASSYVTNPNGAEFTKFVQELTKKYEAKTQSRKVGITRDLEEVSLTARILRTVGKEKTFSSVCSEAWMLCNSNTCTAEELYHALSIHESLQCKTDTTSSHWQAVRALLREKIEKTDSLKEYFHSMWSLSLLKGDFRSFCERMDEWIPSVGLPRWKAKAEVPQGSLQTKELMPAMLLLQLNEICKRKSLGDVLFNFLLKRVAPIDEKRQVVLDKSNSAVLTAFFLKYLLTSQEVSISGQKSTQIISGLLTSISQSSSAINLQELRYLVEIGELLGAKEIYFPEIEEQKIKENSNVTLFYKTIKIKWSFQDLYGQRVSNSKKVIVRIGTWESEASETYILHKVTERSPTVQIEQEIGSQWKFVYSARLFVLVEPALKDFTLTLFKGADKVKDYKEAEAISASQDNRLFVSFGLAPFILPEVSSATLVHVDNPLASKISSGTQFTYDSVTGKFSCSIDIGDPKTIKPISGKYKLTVLIADRHLAAPIQKELSTVSIKFKHEVSLDTLSDGFVVSSPDIIPTFPKKKEYSIIINLITSGLAILSIIYVVNLQLKMKFNTNLFPKHPTKAIYNYIFMGIFGLIYLLWLKFWLEERFFDILPYLVVLAGLALFFGNLALSNLIPKTDKVKTD